MFKFLSDLDIYKIVHVHFTSWTMAPPSEEVDLTSDTPPKKMKQARLPFAPLNKSSAASNKKVGE